MTRRQCGQAVVLCLGMATLLLLAWIALAEARAGGGASSGSRGSASMGSYSRTPSYRGGSTPGLSIPRSSSDAMRSSTAPAGPSRPAPWHAPAVAPAPASPIIVQSAPSGGSSDWLFWWMLMGQNRQQPTTPAAAPAAPAPVQVPLRDPDAPGPPSAGTPAVDLIVGIILIVALLALIGLVIWGCWWICYGAWR